MSVVSIGRFSQLGMGSVNTYWIETATGLIVIDGQRNLSSAKLARDEMAKTGKPILAAFLTHPHPDHFGGIGIFAPENSIIPLYGSAQTRESIQQDSWGLVKASREVVGEDFPKCLRLPDLILADGQRIEIDGVTIVPSEMGGGEAECMTVLHLPGNNVLFSADLLQDCMTPFLLEGRSKAWLGQLQAVTTRFPHIKTVYPGHGEPGPMAELVNRQIEYITVFRKLVANYGPDKASAEMSNRFPGYLPVAANPDLLKADAKALAEEITAEISHSNTSQSVDRRVHTVSQDYSFRSSIKSAPVIQINHLKVAPEHQDQLIEKMTAQLDANMATQPGFISATLHKGRDRKSIVNYVLFESKDDLDAAHQRPEFTAQFQTYKDLVLDAGPVLYDIVARREEEGIAGNDPITQLALAAWRRMTNGFRTGDFEPYLAMLPNDYSFRFPVKPYQEPRSGREEATAYYRMISESKVRMTFSAPLRIARTGETVFIEFEDEGSIGEQSYRNRIVGAFEICNGVISSYREYFGLLNSQVIAQMEQAAG